MVKPTRIATVILSKDDAYSLGKSLVSNAVLAPNKVRLIVYANGQISVFSPRKPRKRRNIKA